MSYERQFLKVSLWMRKVYNPSRTPHSQQRNVRSEDFTTGTSDPTKTYMMRHRDRVPVWELKGTLGSRYPTHCADGKLRPVSIK